MSSTEEKTNSAPVLTHPISRLAAQVERQGFWLVTILAMGVAAVAAVKARYRRLWLDEIMGLLIAKLPHASDIWRIVRTGADNQPPFYHLLTRTSIHMFGNDAWGLRLPSLAGYLLFCLSLYWFVSRRTSKLYGLLAFLFPSLTGCWYYATEGRPYGLVLGCTGLAAVCWQLIALNHARKLMLVGLFLSLAGTLNLHYYSPLLFAPFAFAELVRTFKRRRIDKAVWLALILPSLALIPYLGILRETRVKSGIPFAYYATPTWYGSLAEFTGQFLGPALVALLTIICIYLVWRVVPSPSSLRHNELFSQKIDEFQLDFALLLGFTLLPILGIAFSKFVTHVLFMRYLVGSMFGICALVVIALWLIFSGAKEPALLVGLVICGLFARSSYSEVKGALAERKIPVDSTFRYSIPQRVVQGDLPIVAAGVNEFMDIQYYGGRDLRSRSVYISSEEFANQYLGFTFLERMMIGAAPFFGTKVIDYRQFTREHPTFYMLGGTTWWLLPKLLADGAQLQMLQGGLASVRGDFLDDLFLVRMPGA